MSVPSNRMAKWFWKTCLTVAAVLLILGIGWVFAATLYLVTQGGSSSTTVLEVLGVVATAVGVYCILRAQKLYTESRRSGGIPRSSRRVPGETAALCAGSAPGNRLHSRVT